MNYNKDSDKKLEKILKLQETNMSRDYIAKELGYSKTESLNRFMRERNYRYINNEYVKTKKPVFEIESENKIKKIVELQRNGKNRFEIAQELGYRSSDYLDNFMKEKGFRFINGLYMHSDDRNNFIKDISKKKNKK